MPVLVQSVDRTKALDTHNAMSQVRKLHNNRSSHKRTAVGCVGGGLVGGMSDCWQVLVNYCNVATLYLYFVGNCCFVSVPDIVSDGSGNLGHLLIVLSCKSAFL